MHTLLGLSSVLLVLVGGFLTLGLPRRLGGRSRRRDLPFLVLVAPVVSLGLGIGGLHHFAGRICLLGAPLWDYTLGVALPLGMGLIAVGGLGLGVLRLVLLQRVVARRGTAADGELQALADRLAERVGAGRPQVRLCEYDRPLALTWGFWRPSLLLSTWLVDYLDRRELESVIAHELAHVARRDYLVVWLATVLRDAFFYLPTSWAAYRQLQHEKELACDDLAAGATNRPLALASALAKVWQQALGVPRPGADLPPGAAQALTSPATSLEGRIERLLAGEPATASPPRSRLVALGVGSLALAGLLVLEATNVAVMLAPMGCGPASLLRTLF